MSNKAKRAERGDRRAHLLRCALELASKNGFMGVTRATVAKAAGVGEGTVSNTFGTMVQFRRDLMRVGIEHGNLEIIAHGLLAKHPQALRAPEQLKERARKHIANR